MSERKERKDKLNNIIRNKIALEITLNPRKSHSEISRFYNISRQLVSLIAREYNIQRCQPKGKIGSYNYPRKVKADINLINEKYSSIDSNFFKIIDIIS